MTTKFAYTEFFYDHHSEVVAEVYYNKDAQQLAVVLVNGSGYLYDKVPATVFDALANPFESTGHFYNTLVKHGYGPGTMLGHTGFENSDFFVPVTQPALAAVGTPKGLTYAEGATVHNLTYNAERNTSRKFSVEFETNGKVRTHTLNAKSFGEAEQAVLEIGAMLDLDFQVKVVRVVE